MDEMERKAFADAVFVAMRRQSLTSAKAAELAGISENTMTRVTRGEAVSPGTVSKLRIALGIDAIATVQDEVGYSSDIEIVRDFVGMVLRDLSPEERKEKIRRLTRAIVDESEK